MKPGDFVKFGIIISNSEVGLGAVMVCPFLNRLVYVRDNTTGKFWNVGWEPVKAKPSRFRARHGLGYTVIENTTDGIDASFRVFVPAGDEPAEYWTIRLTPESIGPSVRRSIGRTGRPKDRRTG